MAIKLYFNEAGLVTSADERGQYDMLKEGANPFRYKLVDGVVVDGWPGVKDEDIMPLYNVENELLFLGRQKADAIRQLRDRAAAKIQSLAWKIERATEQDALNGTNTLADAYAEREAVRVASNVAQASINEAESYEEITTAFRLFS